jgi:hypothetical protein
LLIRTNFPFDSLQFPQHNPLPRLVFALAVGVAGFAHLVGLEEQNLAESFVGVDARRKRCGVGDFEVTKPSHSGSNGVTFTMMPQRAWVLLPTQIVRTSRGILKYSTERANANELGGTMQTSERMVTNERSSKFFGSTTVQFTEKAP